MSTSVRVDSSRDDATASVQLWSVESGRKPVEKPDAVAREEPLEIRVRGQRVTVTMRTPGHDEELAVGFLLTEGIIRTREEVVEVAHCHQGEAAVERNVLNVFLAPTVIVDFERLTRHVSSTSSCGVCGKTSIESVHQHFPPVSSEASVSVEALCQLPGLLQAAQETFRRTGGLHAAAIFSSQGRLIALREDIGRHNAVDKIVGFGCRDGQLPFDSQILLVSGRASFEIMQKALAARIPIVAAVSAPSSLAVEFARESGQTLVGFLRGKSLNVYSHAERIRFT